MEAATAQPEEHIPPHHDSERAAFRNTHTSLGAAGHWIRTAGILAPLVIGEFVKDHEQRWQWIRIASGINLSEPFQCHSQAGGGLVEQDQRRAAGERAAHADELPRGAAVPAHAHEKTTEGMYVLEGGVRLVVDGAEYSLRQGDYASIPAGTPHSWQGEAFFTKLISISTPGGLEAALDRVGEATELHMFTEGATLTADALSAGAEGAEGADVQVT